jgi:hypothetical protein
VNGTTVRRRYYVAISLGYIGLGAVIATRSLLAHALPIVLLGIVFAALGAVRLRTYFAWRRDAGGS